jgi:hypothetical protein
MASWASRECDMAQVALVCLTGTKVFADAIVQLPPLLYLWRNRKDGARRDAASALRKLGRISHQTEGVVEQ